MKAKVKSVEPPEQLEHGGRTHLCLTKQLIEVAKVEALHRRRLERRALRANIEFTRMAFVEARIGQCFALVIGLVGIAAVAYCGTHGAQAIGTAIGGSTVVGSMTVFIRGRRDNRGK